MVLKKFILSALIFCGSFSVASSIQAADLYRFYSTELQAHFYTSSVSERDSLDFNSQWDYEGIAYSVSTSDATVPVYRFWSPVYQNHFFTTSVFERDAIIESDPNWSYEGQAFTVTTTGLPVYRFYSQVFQGHFYTTSEAEKDNLIENDSNWNFEGIAWYAKPTTSTSLPSPSTVNQGIAQKAIEFQDIQPEIYPGSQRVIYQIDSSTGNIIGSAEQTDKELWDIIYALAPSKAIRESIVEFEVYHDTGSGFSASVASVGGQLKQWRFSVNYASLQFFSQIPGLITHEYGHLLTYTPEQITTILNDRNVEENCTTYFDDGFCFNKGSYIDTHFQKFWKGTDAFIGRNRTASEALEYYRRNPNDFVSAYATTNVEEDFAETLATYIFQDFSEMQGKRRQKVDSIGGYVSLSNYRQKVREQVKSWAQ